MMLVRDSRAALAVEISPPDAALSDLKKGEVGVICRSPALEADESAMLDAMGLGERVRIRMCRVGEPVVVALGTTEGRNCDCHGHCRIGLARGLAERVRVVVEVRNPEVPA